MLLYQTKQVVLFQTQPARLPISKGGGKREDGRFGLGPPPPPGPRPGPRPFLSPQGLSPEARASGDVLTVLTVGRGGAAVESAAGDPFLSQHCSQTHTHTHSHHCPAPRSVPFSHTPPFLSSSASSSSRSQPSPHSAPAPASIPPSSPLDPLLCFPSSTRSLSPRGEGERDRDFAACL